MQLLFFILFSNALHAEVPHFSFHIPKEPISLNPATITGVELNYFYSNLYEGLYKYDDKEGIVPLGAARPCEQKKKNLVCKLAKVLWSDGTPVTAEHYVQAFRHLIDPQSKSREAGHLLKLEKAKEILEGKAKPEELGVVAMSPTELHFKFASPDYDFAAKLALPALTPWKVVPDKKNSITNGPYRIKDWTNQRVMLEKNPHYASTSEKTPDVDIFFFSEDMTAVNFFDLGKMTFLRRIPTDLKPIYKKKSGYFEYQIAMLDYVGFGPQLASYPDLRKALSLSMNFDEFNTLFDSAKRPGCHGIPMKMINTDSCLNFSVKEAKEALEKFNKLEKKITLYYMYPQTGDDIRRGAEWMQAQWKKNLGLTVELRVAESGMFTQTLTHSPPPIFKKLLYLDRPMCLAAFEIFHSKNPNNFIQLKSTEYDTIVEKIASTPSIESQKKLCADAYNFLLKGHWIVPQGSYRLGGISNPRFKGWKLNSMNQFDLSHLVYE